MSGLLAGLLPRPSTPVPGVWVLPCPASLNVYVFRAAAAASGSGAASGTAGASDATGSTPGAAGHADMVGAGSGSAAEEASADDLQPQLQAQPQAGAAPAVDSKRPTLSLAIPGAAPAPAARAGTPVMGADPASGATAAPAGAVAATSPAAHNQAPAAVDATTAPPPAAAGAAAPAGAQRPPLPAHPPSAATLGALRVDPLERAWCALNTGCSEAEVRALFGSPCAVVRPAARPHDAGKAERERELWVFSASEVPTPEGCVELPRPAPVSLASSLTCPSHGHALSCLSNPTCNPTFTPDMTWHMLEAAAGEKLAWAMGMRIALLPGDTALGPEPFDVWLRPTSGTTALALPGLEPAAQPVDGYGALILSAKPRPPPHCAPFPPAPVPGPGAEPMVLRPLALPALLIAPQTVNAAQDARLSTAFDSALGAGWKAGRTEARVASQVRGDVLSDWSIYFVPIAAAKALATALPSKVATEWRAAHGVITIWPTHLAHPLALPRRLDAPQPVNPSVGLGAPADLLTTATSVFDFFTSYSEPDPEPEDDEEAEEPEEPMVVEDDTSSKREDESVDDLFSTHSSPEPEPEAEPEAADGDTFIQSTFTTPRAGALELATGAGEHHASGEGDGGEDGGEDGGGDGDGDPGDITMDDINDLFGDDDGDNDEAMGDMQPPETVVPAEDAPIPLSRASELTDNQRNMITEDDFNFFDDVSPKLDDGDVELEVATPETPKGERVFEPTGAEPMFEIISRPVSPTRTNPQVAHVGLRLDAVARDLRERIVGEPQPKDETEADGDAVVEGQAEGEAEREAEGEADGEADADEEAPPQKKLRLSLVDLVPPAFAPLQLSINHRPRFKYGLPSPAATVSSLNLDLIDRLRRSQKKRCGSDKVPYDCGPYDYSAGWDVDSDSDETEEYSAATTGGPPTPSSTGDLDRDGTPVPPSLTFPPPPAITDDEVEFDGGVCVGGEWVALKDDSAAARPFARAWAASWAEIKEAIDPYPSPASSTAAIDTVGTRLSDIDVEVLANAVVRNRYFREVFDSAATQQEPVRPPTVLVKSGMALCELADDAAETDGVGGHSKSYILPATTVNVGYGGTVMRISAAGLRYWRELGLGPAGGPKNLTAHVVCQPGADAERTAAAFLKDMGEVYTAHQLGAHDIPVTPEEGEEAKESQDVTRVPTDQDYAAAVTAVPLSGMADTIAKLRSKATKPTIIYVIAYNSSISPEAFGPLLYAPSHMSVVHIVPAASICVANLAALALEVYDQFPRSVAHVNLHGKPIDLPKAWFPYHAFTVAGDDPKPQLSMTWPQRNYDVFNRWRSVHAAWAWLPSVGILLLAVTDVQGDAMEVRALKMEPGSAPAARAQKAWEVFKAFADRTATEWRIHVCALGLMTKDEIDAWTAVVSTQPEPVTLLMVDHASVSDGPPRPRPPVANVPPATFADPGASVIDEALTAGAAPLGRRIAVDLPSSSGCADDADAECSMSARGPTIYPPASFIFSFANQTGTGASTCVFYVLYERAPPGGNDNAASPNPSVSASEVLPRELHRLACLGRRRWGLGGVGVAHLESVGVARRAVEAVARG